MALGKKHQNSLFSDPKFIEQFTFVTLLKIIYKVFSG